VPLWAWGFKSPLAHAKKAPVNETGAFCHYRTFYNVDQTS